MNLNTKLKTLISRSILISPEKRVFLSAMVDHLNAEQISQLIQIFEMEKDDISNVIRDNFSNDPDSELLKKLDEFFHGDQRELLTEIEVKDSAEDARQLDELEKELLEIHSMRDLFRDIRIVLILPDRSGDTVSMGFKLFPRFVSYADGNFMDVAAVLNKMLEFMHEKTFGKEMKTNGRIS